MVGRYVVDRLLKQQAAVDLQEHVRNGTLHKIYMFQGFFIYTIGNIKANRMTCIKKVYNITLCYVKPFSQCYFK